MKLRKICEEIEYTLLQGSLETEVRDIIYDSRKIAPETMFVCMVGAVTDGHKYIPDAVEKRSFRDRAGEGRGGSTDSRKHHCVKSGVRSSGTCADVRCIV